MNRPKVVKDCDVDRLNDYFAACSRDLTPAAARHAARVFYAPLSHDPDVTGSQLWDTSGLEEGSNRLEIVVASKLVAIPSLGEFQFVTAP